MTPLLRAMEHTARVVAADEEELRRRELRLHAHMSVLVIGGLVMTYVLTMDMGEIVILFITWLMPLCQESIDYLGQL